MLQWYCVCLPRAYFLEYKWFSFQYYLATSYSICLILIAMAIIILTTFSGLMMSAELAYYFCRESEYICVRIDVVASALYRVNILKSF